MEHKKGIFSGIEDWAQEQRLDLIAKGIIAGFMSGKHRSPYRGFSVEYAEHHMYNPGDSTRHIDWKVFAKTRRLYTKSYEEETNLRAYFVIDASSSMYYPKERFDKLRFSVYAVAALAQLLQKQRDGVGLFVFSEHISLHMPAKSTQTHFHELCHHLSHLFASTKDEKSTEITKSLHNIVNRVPKRSLIILFSDLFMREGMDEFAAALQHLRYNKHEVLVFHVRDRATECNFAFEDRPYVLHALEGGRRLKVRPQDVRAAYETHIAEWEKALQRCCGTLGVDYFAVDTAEDFNQILSACLVKRSKM